MDKHPHHYILESPHGEHAVLGICKLCGASKAYPAAHDEWKWGNWQLDSYDPRSRPMANGGRRTVDYIME